MAVDSELLQSCSIPPLRAAMGALQVVLLF